MAVTFRTLGAHRLPTFGAMAGHAHVAPWWSDEPTDAAVEKTYGPVVDGADPTDAFIVELDGRPVGFVQRYRLDDYPQWAASLGIERAAGI